MTGYTLSITGTIEVDHISGIIGSGNKRFNFFLPNYLPIGKPEQLCNNICGKLYQERLNLINHWFNRCLLYHRKLLFLEIKTKPDKSYYRM